MADETSQTGMDYSEHDRTYEGFLALTKIGILHVITIMVALAIFAFGGPWSFTLGVLILVLAMAAAAIGMAAKGSAVAPGLVLALSVVLFIMSVAA